MILENEFAVPAPMERVMEALLDGVAVAALPVEEVAVTDDGARTGVLRLRLGPHEVAYRGTVRVAEVDAEAGALSLDCDARESGGRYRGSVRARVAMRLRESGGRTRASLHTEATFTGRIARLPDADVHAALQALLEAMAAEVAERLTIPAAAGPGPLPVDRPPIEVASPSEAQTVPRGGGVSNGHAPVAGTVRLMTEEPIPAERLPVSGGGLSDLLIELRRRRWLVPAVLLGLIALILLARRRTS